MIIIFTMKVCLHLSRSESTQASLAATGRGRRLSRPYALGREDDLLDTNPCLSAWSEDAERRRGLWRQFVMDEDARQRQIGRGDWALGEESFRSRMANV